MEHRYQLEKGSKKHHCPQCNKKTFVKYIDTETDDYLPEHYGRCDRESKCNYHLNPYADGYSKAIWEQEHGNRSELPKSWKPQQKRVTPTPEHQPVFFDFETFKETLSNYDKNTFIQNLLNTFNPDEVAKVIELYRLGTNNREYLNGAISFPFIDINQKVRAVQLKQFDKDNHTINQNWLHSIIKPQPEWIEAYKKNDKIVSCLFGEHLLNKFPNKPIALVEAPKTAIYGWLYFNKSKTFLKDCIWLAVFNKSSFSFDKLKVLQGRFVYVFPDLSKDGSTFIEWETKAKEYEKKLHITRFIFSDLLERLATQQDKDNGSDLADILIKHDWRKFRKRKQYSEYTKSERLQLGLSIFKIEALKDLVSRIFKVKSSFDVYELKDRINEIEDGLSKTDVEDLTDILIIKQLVTSKDFLIYEK
ncbi:MAG: hypothetical protein JSS94_03485 [Bacteroidetes bacterium]|nr:hypothetical protein [Bacteroidota bacterium]